MDDITQLEEQLFTFVKELEKFELNGDADLEEWVRQVKALAYRAMKTGSGEHFELAVRSFDLALVVVHRELAEDDWAEPPRVYRRLKLSNDEPYDTEKTHPVLHG